MRIDDARKIAKTVSAFSNTNGGRLLIGVKDNGMIAGVRAEEEIHMMDAAAKMYCNPPVDYHIQVWKVDHKTILEITIQPSPTRPHLAQLDDGTWKAFVREGDQNFPAPAVLMNVWKSEDIQIEQKYFHTEKEKKIFQVLSDTPELSQSQIARSTGIPRQFLTKLLARLVRWKLLEITFIQGQARFKLKE